LKKGNLIFSDVSFLKEEKIGGFEDERDIIDEDRCAFGLRRIE
jgi:hypothetical protein